WWVPLGRSHMRTDPLWSVLALLRGLQLSPVKLSELHADLKMQEREEFAWKKLKAEGLDADGERAAKLLRNLSVILAKYGLDGRKDAQAVNSNYLSDTAEDDSLGDPKLEKLWHKVPPRGSPRTPERALCGVWSRELCSARGGRAGAVLTPCGLLRGAGVGSAEFEEPRVIDLWDMAKSSNFTEKELESFREELKHFEAKIEKHNHYQKQLEISHQKLKHVESFGDQEHVSRNKEKYAMLEEKTKELGYKLKKHFQDLSGRISRARHNEL
uniref:Alpha-2-macroglobulin receptor-associated protein n=1 Tax=Panthera tigris altaica TaxID=74533 RepID=A0A8C9JH65_PANTA